MSKSKGMNIISLLRRVLAASCALLTLFSLFGCGSKASKNLYDDLRLDGYYIKLANDVTDGELTVEENYYIFEDPEKTSLVGTMTVIYDQEQRPKQYMAIIGIFYTEKLISFQRITSDDGTDLYISYTTQSYNEQSVLIEDSWENTTVDPDTGEVSTSKGVKTFYDSGKDKSVREDRYVGEGDSAKLVSTSIIERDEEGNITEQSVVNYD